MKNILSPLNNSSDISLLEIIETTSLIKDWKNTFSLDISREMNSHHKIFRYQCNQTKLHFFVPENIEGSDKLYEQLQCFDWYYMPDKWEHCAALKDINDCSNVLEIGSALGNFVQKVINNGLNIRGIELNKEAVKVAQSRDLPVEALDLNVLAKTHAEHFDAVCSFQVLEHIAQPRRFIEASLDVLKPGGKLIYCVPNAESFLQYQYNLLDMPPHHVTRWSKATFKALESLFPVQLERLRFEPLTPYHISGFLSAYSNHFRTTSPLYKSVFNRLSLPIYNKALSLGVRHFFRGQSLYVQFRKLA